MLGILIHQNGVPFKSRMRHSSSPVFMGHGAWSRGQGDSVTIRHGLAPHPGDVAGDLEGRPHEKVAQGAGDLANPAQGVRSLPLRFCPSRPALVVGQLANYRMVTAQCRCLLFNLSCPAAAKAPLMTFLRMSSKKPALSASTKPRYARVRDLVLEEGT